MVSKCDGYIYSRLVVSENGFHSVCCLSDNAAIACLTGKVNMRAVLAKSGGGEDEG